MPLTPEVLLEAVTSLEELRDLLSNPRLRAAIGRIEKLPSPPHLYLSLMHALEGDDGADAADIAKLIASDPAIAAKVLQLCNSAFFSGGRSITDLRTAVTRLGVATLRDLVLASEVFSVQTLTPAERTAMQRRALLSSRLAAKVLPPTSAELGSTAALLADIGLLLPGVRDEREPPTTAPTNAWATPKPAPTCSACGACRCRSSKRWPSIAIRSVPACAASGLPARSMSPRHWPAAKAWTKSI